MQADDIVRLLRARRCGKGRWIARCPVHGDKSPSLTISEGKHGILLKCQSHGCDVKAILEVLGMKWGDLFYRPRVFDPKAAREQGLQRRDAAAKRFNFSVGEWIIRFIDQGYTRENRTADITTVCACAIVLQNKSSAHWERILETHLARIMAAEHCRERGMLPETASQ